MAVILSPDLNNDTARKSLGYQKLPQKLLNLSILKLDGSLFDVQVPNKATLAELKEAVEDVFDELPMDKDNCISWSHVWSHFCLCYEGNKLVNDKTYIRVFGIKDGDQLHFTKHRTLVNHKRAKRRATTLQRSLSDYEQLVPWIFLGLLYGNGN